MSTHESADILPTTHPLLSKTKSKSSDSPEATQSTLDTSPSYIDTPCLYEYVLSAQSAQSLTGVLTPLTNLISWRSTRAVTNAVLKLGLDRMNSPDEGDSSIANPFVNLAEISLSEEPKTNLNLEDLAVDDDALSFTPVEQFSGESSPFVFDGTLDYTNDSLESEWATPSTPCANCTAWGYQCQLPQQPQSQGRCIPCMSVGCDCSFLDTTSDLHSNDVKSIVDDSCHISTGIQQPPTPEASKRSSGSFEPFNMFNTSTPPPPPKIGTRFSRDSTRILRQWLSSHSHHPYPNDEEKKILQHQTGLSKIQITNWLINARRRGKVQGRHRSISPYSGNSATGTKPIDVPARPGTPAPRSSPRYQSLNPLERWVDSPPEHEPATVTAIARAVASTHAGSSAANESSKASATDEPARSLYHTSSASSAGTSSGGSFASAFSHVSKDSVSLPRPVVRSRARQRRRPKRTSLANPRNQFQCTFCTETFRTKHDWQRHEKSLHMPLERWVCSPEGPRAVNPDTGQQCCVFCGETEPAQSHIDSHNPSSCQERTFNRKDHLKQHLRLVHNAGLLDWSAKLWKITVPDIQSRCGFCGASLDTWGARADHLADHFKMGSDMASWKGDWGFNDAVLEMVENSVPPYLIEYERFSPFPYQASGTPPESPRSAYELLTLELNHFLRLFFDKTGNLPNNREIQFEACRIVFASEVSSPESDKGARPESWLRDLITSSEDLTREARFGPIRSPAESMMSILQIKGKRSLFDGCPCESQLDAFVDKHRLLGPNVLNNQELQNEACKIVTRLGKGWGMSPADLVVNWLVNLISSSSGWLTAFRLRTRLLQCETSHALPSLRLAEKNVQLGRGDPMGGRCSQNEHVDPPFPFQSQPDGIPFDKGLWRNLAIPDQRVWQQEIGSETPQPLGNGPLTQQVTSSSDVSQVPDTTSTSPLMPSTPGWQRTGSTGPDGRSAHPQFSTIKRNYAFFNDANFNRWLAQELRRWIAATMSPNNPNSHVPSDHEIQHQARFIVYEDGDPWNQTSADNLEWLHRFKRSIGMVSEESQDTLQGKPANDTPQIP
ncbi:hypothetical protein CORC01_05611 [Colletotrichum orchidophilum]|uniref:Homeobox and C2H2 transcription factor n=1 Tax=Colletotrichum orchidophilum TaxID=1209926 RepID=A0A1G4BCI3_9PEZI|nr:uncharacterized protein CORC01_05611 [Colletotrichum orchidophilum]OHE99118.1 hypothetical protein CORC01_05611 [Colletotrichum orchidophilum]